MNEKITFSHFQSPSFCEGKDTFTPFLEEDKNLLANEGIEGEIEEELQERGEWVTLSFFSFDQIRDLIRSGYSVTVNDCKA